MTTINRELTINLPKGQSAFLWGARKTGKTTFLKQEFPEAKFIDLLHNEIFVKYSLNPEFLRKELIAISKDLQKDLVVIIDEVQKIPKLLDEVHWLIENIKNIKFILCGSSSRKLKSSGANMLGGRAWSYKMLPLCYKELKELDYHKIFNNGLIPDHYYSQEASRSLSAYLYDYLINEVQIEANIRKRDPFVRFLNTLSFCNGEMINYTNIARDCGVNKATVKSYFEILEDMYIGYFVHPYANKKSRQIVTEIPKFYLFDTAIANYLSDYKYKELKGSLAGKAFEHYIYLELKAYQTITNSRSDINYYRDSQGNEVDFIYKNHAFEVKIKSNASVKDMKGLKIFANDYDHELHLICSTDHKRIEKIGLKEITIWPAEDFLKSLWRGEFD